MRNILAAFVMALTLGLGLSAWAAPDSLHPATEGTSLEWQRIDLEDMLHTKINQALSQNIPEKYFNVTVGISLKPKALTKKSPSVADALKANAANSADSAPTPGKLGVDLSLLVLAREERDASKNQDTGPDLFSNISRINVNILLDDKLPDAKTAVVRTLVRGIVGSVAPVPASINVSKAPVYTSVEELQAKEVDPKLAQKDSKQDASRQPASETKTQETPAEKPWDMQRWVTEMKYPAGMLVIALLMTLLGIVYLKGHMRIENRRIALLEAQNQREELNFQRDTRPGSNPLAAATPAEQATAEAAAEKVTEKVEHGTERFQAILTQAPERAAQLISQWIKNPKRGAAEALALLPQILRIEELNLIFARLSIEEKKEWRRFLSSSLDAAGIRLADSFIASQIVESFLVPGPRIDPALRSELSELSLSDCLELIRSDVELGAILVNVLPSGLVSRIFSVLPVELASEVTLSSVKITEAQIAQRSKALKEAVEKVKSGNRNVQFLDNPEELMRDVGPERENAIFTALADSGEYRLLEKVARQFYPAELILRLPAPVLKSCLEAIPVEKRAELIFSREKDEQQQILDLFGRPGARMRDLLDLEIERIGTDEVRTKLAERNRNLLWKELADLCRNAIRADSNAAEAAETALNSWLYDRSNGAVGGLDADAA